MLGFADVRDGEQRQSEERERWAVGHRQRRMNQHRRGEVDDQRGDIREVRVIQQFAEEPRQREVAGDRGDDADADERAECVADEEVHELAEEDVERIAGRVRMEAERIEIAQGMGEEETMLMPTSERNASPTKRFTN